MQRNDFFRTETDLYLKSNWFGQVFGLHCNFNFRALRIELEPDVELPIIRLLMREKARENLYSLFNEKQFENYIGLRPTLANVGVLDWALATHSNYINNNDERYYVYKLEGGMELLGGGLFLRLYNDTRTKFNERNLGATWHYVNNDNPYLRQVQIGNVNVPAAVEFYDRFQGASVNNLQTSVRKKFSTQLIQEYTEPNWLVELYVNEHLVDFTQADETGYFQFKVPVRYGSTTLKLKYLGPWGEERIKETSYTIPHVFLPPGESEFSVSGGRTESTHHLGLFANMQYGIFNWLTAGVQAHAVQTQAGDNIENLALLSSCRVAQNILLTTELHTIGNFSFQSNYTGSSGNSWQFSYYTKSENEIYNRRRLKQHASVSFNFPHLILPMRGQNRLRIMQEQYKTYDRLKFDYNTSIGFGNFNPNFSTEWEWRDRGFSSNLIARSQVSVNVNAKHRIRIRPLISYDHHSNEWANLQLTVEKSITQNGWLSIYAAKTYQNKSLQLSYRHDFPICRVATHASLQGNSVYSAISANGGIAFSQKRNKIFADKRSMASSGGLIVIPFLDLNNNEQYDANEPKVDNLEVITNQGQLVESEKDTLIYILNLPEYSTQLLEFSERNFENISWKPKHTTMGVMVQPFMFKQVFVPIVVQGEIWGNVVKNGVDGEKGIPGMKIHVQQTDGDFSITLMSLYEGYFEFMGLPPGHFKAFIDKKQLQDLHLQMMHPEIEFEIKNSKQGDYAPDVNFEIGPQSN